MTHPREHDLALLAGGEAGPIRRFLLDRHVRDCADCRRRIAEYHELRDHLAEIELPPELQNANWNFVAAEMRANIRLGLEAGACVREERVPRRWNPRPVMAFACVLLLAAAAELFRDARPHRPAADSTPVVQSTVSGVELRDGPSSMMLLNHHGNTATQTVSARGDISGTYIDGDTGSVTINNVSLQ